MPRFDDMEFTRYDEEEALRRYTEEREREEEDERRKKNERIEAMYEDDRRRNDEEDDEKRDRESESRGHKTRTPEESARIGRSNALIVKGLLTVAAAAVGACLTLVVAAVAENVRQTPKRG
ncbi:hypothetical protein PCA31118_03940 [Pandoraea captiosa]|uniref:Uncharacterized protein n=1 Tax=Pandoraea captiosa TaxID=2508302 RepID=A0A5E5ADJ7_9BURK|nr:hypothetical protein [Pandoraea captiosa]VVE71664.1 hypothetical protein PCA31118_03940 [Pandoraea captiosa]